MKALNVLKATPQKTCVRIINVTHVTHMTQRKCVTPIVHMHNIQNENAKRDVKVHISLHDIDTSSYLIGKSIVLFTMFYCGLNWFHYKQLREEMEEANNANEKDNKKKGDKVKK
jgi:hypothetical protein